MLKTAKSLGGILTETNPEDNQITYCCEEYYSLLTESNGFVDAGDYEWIERYQQLRREIAGHDCKIASGLLKAAKGNEKVINFIRSELF